MITYYPKVNIIIIVRIFLNVFLKKERKAKKTYDHFPIMNFHDHFSYY